MSQRTSPPFRADHVGSLLRPLALKQARAQHAKGEIDATALKAVEDREIEKVVKKQEEVGLQLAVRGGISISSAALPASPRSRPRPELNSTALKPSTRRSASTAKSRSRAIRSLSISSSSKAIAA